VTGLRRFAKRASGTHRLGDQPVRAPVAPPPQAAEVAAPPSAGAQPAGAQPAGAQPAALQPLDGLAGLLAGLPALDSIPGLAGTQSPDADAAGAEVEHCELCREVLNDRHGHLVHTENR